MIYPPLVSVHGISFSRRLRAAFASRRARGAMLAGLVLAAGAGCATGDFAYVATVAGGERITIPLVKGSPELAKKDGVKILHAGGSVNKEKQQLGYLFALIDEGSPELRSIVIEDVSDETAVPLLEDLAPKVVHQRWVGTSRLFSADDPGMKWLGYVSDSVRVFRFTVTRSDGTKIVLHQGSRVPAWAKAGIRGGLGEKP